jgi:hypothetical protein
MLYRLNFRKLRRKHVRKIELLRQRKTGTVGFTAQWISKRGRKRRRGWPFEKLDQYWMRNSVAR